MMTLTDTETISDVSAKIINVEKLIETSLPSSTNSLMKIRRMLGDVNASNTAISNAIIYQPLLVARILRLANSSVYLSNKMISSIPMAINVVGTKVISDIVTMEITLATFKKTFQNSIYAKKIWEHSLAVALIARTLSENLKINGGEEVFTCGLMHDIGKMLILTLGDKEYSEVVEADSEAEMLSLEKRKYGYTHTKIGALIANRWELPEDICYTILHHHDSSNATQCNDMICLIDVADIIANAKGYGVRQMEYPEPLCDELLNSQSAMFLGLTKETIDEVCTERLDNALQEIISTFS